MVSIDDLRRKS